MRRSWYRSAASAIVMGVLLAVAGCGSIEDNVVAPEGSTITFAPTDVTWTANNIDVIEEFTVALRNADGIPLNDTQIRFTVSQAPGAFQFVNGDGSFSNAESVTRMTNDNGIVLLRVRVFGTAPFADDIEARSGTAFGSANISVTAATTP